MPIYAITMPIGAITMPIYAITMDRSGRSRWAVFRIRRATVPIREEFAVERRAASTPARGEQPDAAQVAEYAVEVSEDSKGSPVVRDLG
ncbi:hypothetical protein OV203_05065 [Nannocystis sp. ILAH1]|uniref:hypothetical protein n=1 Tax=Nannocystis sp. ILAH1 TaxID=2996789 RepID=UPI0022710A29|nr:hypothetical protein [Nannocystis sp. ILAH1]MCY0986476.1 hypothetical protein [Nannocystis sp. ILAH1]